MTQHANFGLCSTIHILPQLKGFALRLNSLKWGPSYHVRSTDHKNEKLLSLKFDGPVYISLDLDVFDPAFAPGVSHHEPGGLAARDVLRMIQQLEAQIVGADVVELNIHRDLVDMTAMLAAKCSKELLARILEN